MTSLKDPKKTIDYAEWPRDAPSALERNIISVICGNSRLHWALHEGSFNKFIPIMFWHTPHDDENDNAYEEENPCDVLEAHVAIQAHSLIFGDDENRGCIESVSETAAKRDASGISVFVVSSNPRVEKKLCYMFRDVPAKLFKLRNTDFLTAEQGVYPTMGVDRVAALYGAQKHYGSPVMVIDGGTAMTYTALDKNGKIMGGGISPGVKVRLQSLADYTGSLPIIDHQKFKSMVEGAIIDTPLPFFATDTEMAMISPVCGELACQLRNIVKQFVARCRSSTLKQQATAEAPSSEQTKLPVIITGGDGKFLNDLLKDDASGIVSLEPDASPSPANVDIQNVRNLVTYALGDVINENHLKKSLDSDEKLRLKIQGLRIAAPRIAPTEPFTRGCVFNITPKPIIEGYTFHARFDNGSQKDLTLRELYDFLVLYTEIGENTTTQGAVTDEDEDWVTEKKIWSKKVQEELKHVSKSIRIRSRELKPFIEKGEVHQIIKRSSIRRPLSGKKTKRSLEHLPNHIGKRIAKAFPIEHASSNADPSEEIFFGSVKYVSDPRSCWYFVEYDDGDSEDLGFDEVLSGINLYEQHRHNDIIANKNKDSSSNPSEINLLVGKKLTSVSPQSVIEEDGVCSDLSGLIGLSSSIHVDETSRRISEFKEDV